MFVIVKTSEGWVVREQETARVVVGPCPSTLAAEAEYESKAPSLWAALADDRIVEASLCRCGFYADCCDDCAA